ncbi:unnamed protein product [Rotaria sordida]|uniref:Uncharacterized protein n=1 Tax=Rotaria sordida TaxID=392033 RepID=A0A815JCV9_9BILA|nr:unnamed protein product [Rotaria sordida]CAF1175499.1 unnamed protein product [Rotaria sordida]CAF1183242.1 unnamed protein product [Rotaria sordida]CAF1274711.1 unnamed protein product [Rotaria sordida]CAF1380625.1 unnamed protein product [Rotaria sordida]
MKPVLLLFPKTLLKSFSDVNELPLSYRHLTKGRQFTVGDHKLRARHQNDSTAESYCFQRSTNGNEAHLISSSVETYSLVQDIEPPTDCAPKEVTFRPEFPKQLKLRCLPFGSDEPKIIVTKSTIKKKKKRSTN